jgi:putative phage-type endonuclease
MKYHYDIIQGSEEWFKLRSSRITASHAQAIGSCGKGLDTYIRQILSEELSSAEKENYTNEDMDRGNELEDQARSIYELETGNKVKEVGGVSEGDFLWVSPDGLVGDDGGIEIKCLKDTTYTSLLIDEKIETKWIWQIQMNLLVMKRDWIDFVAYNPNFKRSMYIKRIEPEKEMFEALEKGFKKGQELYKKYKKKL